MKKQLLYLLLSMVVIGICACKKGNVEDKWIPTAPPNIFYFQIIHQGNTLPDSVLDSLKLYYYEDGYKIERWPNSEGAINGEFIRLPSDEGINKNLNLEAYGIRAAPYVNNWGINTVWYFEYENGDIDTLLIESNRLEYEDALLDPCYCQYPYSKIQYNGKDATIHPNLRAGDGKNVYVLEKQ
jgi:hypothetical protein